MEVRSRLRLVKASTSLKVQDGHIKSEEVESANLAEIEGVLCRNHLGFFQDLYCCVAGYSLRVVISPKGLFLFSCCCGERSRASWCI